MVIPLVIMKINIRRHRLQCSVFGSRVAARGPGQAGLRRCPSWFPRLRDGLINTPAGRQAGTAGGRQVINTDLTMHVASEVAAANYGEMESSHKYQNDPPLKGTLYNVKSHMCQH